MTALYLLIFMLDLSSISASAARPRCVFVVTASALLVAATSAAATVGPANLGPDVEQSARYTAYIMEGKNADSFLVTKAAPQCNKAIEKYNGTHDG